ncbi:MAG: type II toxin-antitoxin system Phd/YefM family antitoxin [Alphaproteobacteria bacterium]
MDKEISVREANQTLSKCLEQVEAGETFIITKRGRAIARLSPVQTGKRALTPKQQAALERTRQRMEKGLLRLGGKMPSRDEIYDEMISEKSPGFHED